MERKPNTKNKKKNQTEDSRGRELTASKDAGLEKKIGNKRIWTRKDKMGKVRATRGHYLSIKAFQ
jgi:hypothetical protein